jgi:hypothetical protein
LVVKRRAGELLKELARAEHNRNPEGANQHQERSVSTAGTQTSPYAEALATAWVSRKTANRSI